MKHAFVSFYNSLIVWLVFVCSCCCTAWPVFSVFGAYRPVSILGKRSLHLPGDLMAKVRNDILLLLVIRLYEKIKLLYSTLYSPVLAFSLGDTKQVVLCGVEKAEILHVFPMQNTVTCMHWMEVMEESRYEWGSGLKLLARKINGFLRKCEYLVLFVFRAFSAFCNSEDESKLFLPKLPTLPKR